MILNNNCQGNDSLIWLAQRASRFTASEFHKLVREKAVKGGYTKKSEDAAIRYIRKKVNNCFIDFEANYEIKGFNYNYLSDSTFKGKSVEHGNRFEPFARRHYCNVTGIEDVYFTELFDELTKEKAERGLIYGHYYTHEAYPLLVSPDGEVMQQSIYVEFKCPEDDNFAEISEIIEDCSNIGMFPELLLEYNKSYYYQLMIGMYATSSKTAHFCNFHPYMVENKKMQIMELKRDESVMAEIESVLKWGSDIYNELYFKKNKQ